MTISLDFDGVLVDHPDIPSDDKNWWKDKPVRGSLEAVNELSKNHSLYICTARVDGELPLVEKWLRDNAFPKLEVTNKKKPYTDIYVDDRAIRFTNWNDIYKYFT